MARDEDPPSGEHLSEGTRAMREMHARRSERKKPAGVSQSIFDKRSVEAQAFMDSGEWSDASPIHFVCAYAILFAHVYGVEPTMSTHDRSLACINAANVLRTAFGGDRNKLAAFVQWTWSREKGREDWRRANGKEGQVIGWRLQFSTRLIDEHRVALIRQEG